MNSEENKYFEEAAKILSGELKGGIQPDAETRKAWDDAGSYRYEAKAGDDQAWNMLRSKLTEQQPLQVSWFRKYRIAVAASAALMMAGGAAIWYASRTEINPSFTCNTGKGEIKTVNLSDGSVITLNANSQLIVEEGFNQNQRKLVLHGEANFEVARNEAIPFEVYAGQSTTRVLGTGFDIEAYSGEDVKIIVAHGKVSFSGSKGRMILVKGQSAGMNSKTGEVMALSDSDAVKWNSSGVVFKKASLKDVAKYIRHVHGMELVYNAKDADRTFTGKFDSGTSAEFIAATLEEALQTPVHLRK